MATLTQNQITVEIDNNFFVVTLLGNSEILAEDNWTAIGHKYELLANTNINGLKPVKIMTYYSGKSIIILQNAKGKRTIQECIVLW
jgi:hypothetical protein